MAAGSSSAEGASFADPVVEPPAVSPWIIAASLVALAGSVGMTCLRLLEMAVEP